MKQYILVSRLVILVCRSLGNRHTHAWVYSRAHRWKRSSRKQNDGDSNVEMMCLMKEERVVKQMRSLASHWPKNIHVDYGKKPQRKENNTSKVEEEVKRKKSWSLHSWSWCDYKNNRFMECIFVLRKLWHISHILTFNHFMSTVATMVQASNHWIYHMRLLLRDVFKFL